MARDFNLPDLVGVLTQQIWQVLVLISERTQFTQGFSEDRLLLHLVHESHAFFKAPAFDYVLRY